MALIDTNHNGTPQYPDVPNPDSLRMVAPVVTGTSEIEIDVLSAQVSVVTNRHKQPGTDSLFLVLIARVDDPATGTPLSDASVQAGNGTYHVSLPWQPSMHSYAAMPNWEVSSGDYTYDISQATAYPNPLTISMFHHSVTDLPNITSPNHNHQYGTVQDVQVMWQNAPGAHQSDIQVHGQNSLVFEAEKVTSPYTISATAAGFVSGQTYNVIVFNGFYATDGCIFSISNTSQGISIGFD